MGEPSFSTGSDASPVADSVPRDACVAWRDASRDHAAGSVTRGRSTYTTKLEAWADVSWRARCTALLTTPVRLRSRSRPSKPTRIHHHAIKQLRQLGRE